MIDLDLRRRFFAEELEAVARIRSAALVDAFASVPREHFLGPGPWTILNGGSESVVLASGMGTRLTEDADPKRVYHNIAIAIDPARQLFNGQPGTLALWIDALDLAPGARVLHLGSGLGYYSAVMAASVGETGRVVACEVDAELSAQACTNLATMPWVEPTHGDGSCIDGTFDAILVNAGVTHPLDIWLASLAPGGRMIVPITAAMPTSTLGKGLTMLITRGAEDAWSARVQTFVMVYSALGVRDESMNAPIGRAIAAGPARWDAVSRLRRDPHEPDATCWLHGATCCFSAQ
jgi:protein-L-isoaspartate(D-aspartate) O-methyltransferase